MTTPFLTFTAYPETNNTVICPATSSLSSSNSIKNFDNFNNRIKFNILENLVSQFLFQFIPSEFPSTNNTFLCFPSQYSYTSLLFNSITKEEVKQNICNLFNWELEQFENYINQKVIKVIPYPGGLAMGYDEISYDYYMYEINTFDLMISLFMN